MLLTIPYRAQHYVLKDVLDRFKAVLFEFGRGIFPQLMQQEGWIDPEALSIRGFEDILCKYRTWREVYGLYEKQWLSLRHIRNASVHEAAVLDLDRFEELLDDVKDLAYVLEGYEIEALVDGYYGLLARYKEEYIEFLSTHQKKLQDGLNTIEHDRDVALKDLAAMEHEEEDKTKQSEINEKFSQMRQDLTFSCQRIDRDKQNVLTRDLVRYALKSHMRHCLSLEDTVWAAEATKSLAKEYAASTGIRS
ncbi:hypothetical protein GMOD_00002190 [Pyrenophora seminiperda CCB06]|uniref:Uncharacterized protein n=1 Tax=Pyrenophora seminiperda CCB06 TaxID=1302712 RepID=A0A3M7LXF8_9PLEO|nr:hypothetical protein GMOD_00002190 [Pyrenophora seminiperda CCB06]